jgi:hypothetical protein
MEVRAGYFRTLARIMVPLVVGFGVISNLLSSSVGWKGTLLAGLAGALGSVVSGAFHLRELTSITQLRLLGMGMAVQALIGAAVGLFILLLIQGDILGFPGVKPENKSWAIGIYAFLGGFSEPFFLGVVRRLAGGEAPKPTEEKKDSEEAH